MLVHALKLNYSHKMSRIINIPIEPYLLSVLLGCRLCSIFLLEVDTQVNTTFYLVTVAIPSVT